MFKKLSDKSKYSKLLKAEQAISIESEEVSLTVKLLNLVKNLKLSKISLALYPFIYELHNDNSFFIVTVLVDKHY